MSVHDVAEEEESESSGTPYHVFLNHRVIKPILELAKLAISNGDSHAVLDKALDATVGMVGAEDGVIILINNNEELQIVSARDSQNASSDFENIHVNTEIVREVRIQEKKLQKTARQ